MVYTKPCTLDIHRSEKDHRFQEYLHNLNIGNNFRSFYAFSFSLRSGYTFYVLNCEWFGTMRFRYKFMQSYNISKHSNVLQITFLFMFTFFGNIKLHQLIRVIFTHNAEDPIMITKSYPYNHNFNNSPFSTVLSIIGDLEPDHDLMLYLR